VSGNDLAEGFWTASTPWWATVGIALLATGTTLLVMSLNNRAAKKRDEVRLRADDQRRDRQTVASVQAASDKFSLALRRYYKTWVASVQDDTSGLQDTVDGYRSRAQGAADDLHEALLAAQVVLTSRELVASGERLEAETRELLRKISLYEQGFAFRTPGPGSVDMLFGGFNEELALYMTEARRVLHDR
jgi:hypothetical protein